MALRISVGCCGIDNFWNVPSFLTVAITLVELLFLRSCNINWQLLFETIVSMALETFNRFKSLKSEFAFCHCKWQMLLKRFVMSNFVVKAPLFLPAVVLEHLPPAVVGARCRVVQETQRHQGRSRGSPACWGRAGARRLTYLFLIFFQTTHHDWATAATLL